jgi:hypothetical protein
MKNLIKLSNQKCSILKFKSSYFDKFQFYKDSNYKKLTETKETKKEKCLPDAVGPGGVRLLAHHRPGRCKATPRPGPRPVSYVGPKNL